MGFNDKKTSIMKLVDLLKTHELLMHKCPEVLEIIESYLSYERYVIEKAFRTGKEIGNCYVENGEDKFYLTATQYYYQTFNTGQDED